MLARRKRSGATLVQALVVLSLGFAAMGVVLPGITKIRAKADIAKCANNLRLMGTGIHDYADAHDGLLPKRNTDTPPPKGSYITRILPHSGPASIARNYHWDLDWAHPDNAEFIQTRLPMAQCPATPNPDRWIEGTSGQGETGQKYKAAPSDYVAIGQLTNALKMADVFPPNADLTSVMPGANDRKITDIPDGASNTLLVVEIADKPNRWQAGKLIQANDLGGNGSGTWAASNGNAPRGYTWDGKSFPGPCAMNCSNRAAVYAFHSDGSNILFADGSVRFMNKDLDVWVFYAITTSRGGEVLTTADF